MDRHGDANPAYTHGHAVEGRVSATYSSWRAMRKRCLCPKDQAFDRYGGRGITVCDRWSSFANFVADMGERPVGLTLDRKENDKSYEPGNCRWATRMVQQQNRRGNVTIEIAGRVACLSVWCREYGVRLDTAWKRRHRDGLEWVEVLTRPVRNRERKRQ